MVLYHPFNSKSRISAMHRQFNLFDWFPYIRAHIGVNCLELTGRCIWLACNGPPWRSIISRVNSCLSILLSFSLTHLCVGGCRRDVSGETPKSLSNSNPSVRWWQNGRNYALGLETENCKTALYIVGISKSPGTSVYPPKLFIPETSLLLSCRHQKIWLQPN